MSIRTKFAVVVSKGRMLFIEKMNCDYCGSPAFLPISDWIDGTEVTIDLMNHYHVPVKSKITMVDTVPNLITYDDDPVFDECCDRCFEMEYTD